MPPKKTASKPDVQETRIVTKFLRARPKDSWTFEAARKHNKAYSAFEKALGMDRDAILEHVTVSGLRGRGGASHREKNPWAEASVAERVVTPRARPELRTRAAARPVPVTAANLFPELMGAMQLPRAAMLIRKRIVGLAGFG